MSIAQERSPLLDDLGSNIILRFDMDKCAVRGPMHQNLITRKRRNSENLKNVDLQRRDRNWIQNRDAAIQGEAILQFPRSR